MLEDFLKAEINNLFQTFSNENEPNEMHFKNDDDDDFSTSPSFVGLSHSKAKTKCNGVVASSYKNMLQALSSH